MLSVKQTQGFKVWFYVGFVNLVRVFVAVHSRGMAATLATRGRSTSRKRAARTWLTSRRHVCPARWTSSPPTMTVYSALTSVCAPLCQSTQTRWSNTHRFTRPPTMEAGERGILNRALNTYLTMLKNFLTPSRTCTQCTQCTHTLSKTNDSFHMVNCLCFWRLNAQFSHETLSESWLAPSMPCNNL